MQNDSVWTCCNVKRRDVAKSKMHKKAKLLSLKQRRSLQLMDLMYIHKDNIGNLKVMPRNTRAAQRDHFM